MYLRSRSSGFTLIELMVTLVVLAIVLGAGVPSFTRMTEDNRVATEANRLLSSLIYARSEALRLNAPVTLEFVGSGLADGWCVHQGDGCDGTELRTFSGIRSEANLTGVAGRIVFDARGRRTVPSPGAVDVSVALKPPGCTEGLRQSRVRVGATGRVNVEREACS